MACIAPTFAQAQETPPQNTIAPNATREVRGENATPNNPRPMGALNVRDFGARGDAKTDDTAAFQAALDAASEKGGVVFAPAGQYRLNGSLDVPPGVALEGTWRGPHTSQLSIGTTLLPYGGRGDENAKPFINLHNGSTLKGVTIYYPEQTVTVPDPGAQPVLLGEAPPHWTLPVGAPQSDAWIRGEWGSGPDRAQEWPDFPDSLMRWTGARPIIFLPVIPNREYSLRIFAAVRPQSLKSGSNEIILNGRVIGQFTKDGPQVFEAKIPASLIGKNPLAKLEMRAGTWRPAEGGSTDPRTLGIALRQIEIVARGAEETPPEKAQLPTPDIGVAAYPWTIQGRGAQYNVIDTTIVNAWNGIDCGSYHNIAHHLRNVLMCALRRGVFIDQCTDIGRLENVHIHSVYWWQANAPGVPLAQEQTNFFSNEKINALNTFTQANLEGFIFGRTDWEYVSNCFVIWANVGMKFVHTDTPIGGEPNVLLTQSGSDISIYAARVLATQTPAGISFTNAQMNGIVQIERSNEGPVKFTASNFYGSGNVDSEVVSDGRGRVSFENCVFNWWDQNERDAPAIHALGGVIGVANSEFMSAKNHIVLEKDVRAATILGNFFHGAMRLENQSKGNVQIGLNADSPPPAPAVLTRRFFSGFENRQPQPFLSKPEIVAHRGAYSLRVESGGRGENGRALILRGNAVDTSKEPARAYFRIFEGKIVVRPETILRYWIRPDDAEARRSGIDLVFDDGTALRDSAARDGAEQSLHPAQPKGAIGQWTRIESPIGKTLAGKTIIAILAAHDGFGGDAFRVAFDDLEIGDAK